MLPSALTHRLNELLSDGWILRHLDGQRTGDRAAVFAEIAGLFPLDPPIVSSRSWDALADSLSAGLISFPPSTKLLLLWSSTHVLLSNDRQTARVAREVLQQVVDLCEERADVNPPGLMVFTTECTMSELVSAGLEVPPKRTDQPNESVKVQATIELLSTSMGGKTRTIGNGGDYGCLVFFAQIPKLSTHGWSCRLLLKETQRVVAPGQVAHQVGIRFMSEHEVLPEVGVGTEFELWEAGNIGRGTITAIDDMPLEDLNAEEPVNG